MNVPPYLDGAPMPLIENIKLGLGARFNRWGY
jgi:hypothetical protein